jgi:hypothetical protein
MRLRATLLAALALCLAPASVGASVPALRGAAAHPLSEDRATFDQELDAIKAAGGNEVRIDVGWATFEFAGKGQYDSSYLSNADQFFDDAAAKGVKVVATLWQTPCWASSAPADVKDGCSSGWWESPRDVQLYPPTKPQDFADAAKFVVNRWKDKGLVALEVWNEPNYIPYFFNVPDRHTAEDDYFAMLKATYQTVKPAAPGVAVIGPAMLDSDTDFLTGLYDRGLASYSDGVSLRPFNGGRDPYDTSVPPDGDSASFWRGVPETRQTMVTHGDSAKKLWFTELGWSSCVNPDPPAPPISSWCVGPEKQAQYIADAYRIVRDRWSYVQLFNIYTLRNTGSDTSRESQMGMLEEDFTPKPSYDAFKDVLAEPVPTPPAAPQPAKVTPPPYTPAATPVHHARPVLSKLRLSHGRLSFKLTRGAKVTFTPRRLRGRHWVRTRKPLVLKMHAGANKLKLSRLLGRHPKLGRYRIALVARDSAGAKSKAMRLSFRLR